MFFTKRWKYSFERVHRRLFCFKNNTLAGRARGTYELINDAPQEARRQQQVLRSLTTRSSVAANRNKDCNTVHCYRVRRLVLVLDFMRKKKKKHQSILRNTCVWYRYALVYIFICRFEMLNIIVILCKSLIIKVTDALMMIILCWTSMCIMIDLIRCSVYGHVRVTYTRTFV